MKVIKSGHQFTIHDDGMIVLDKLEPAAYTVGFNPQAGFFLSKHADIEVKEKVYGVHTEKVNKVLKAFTHFERNLGVILSGDKGIGKSLFSKCLSIAAIERGLPLILVESGFNGIGSFIESIEQECIVLFDEFDKHYSINGDTGPQNSLLSLFDGLSTGKKLFCITCNSLAGLNEFLINRPGRFHYHFQFDYPTADEIREYLKDNITSEDAFTKNVLDVVKFSQKTRVNYDCLRAIVFELNQGLSFVEAVKDLNISNMGAQYYNCELILDNGEVLKNYLRFDMFNHKEVSLDFDVSVGRGSTVDGYEIYFKPFEIGFNAEDNCLSLVIDEETYWENSMNDNLSNYEGDNPEDWFTKEFLVAQKKYQDIKPVRINFYQSIPSKYAYEL